MSDYRLMFPTRFLGSPDLQGKEVTVKISSIKLEGLESQDETGKNVVRQKAVVTLDSVAKPWILNRTCAEGLALMFGPDTAQWKGKPIVLHSVMVDSFGQQVPAIRIKGAPHLKEPISRTIKRGRKKLNISLVPTGSAPVAAPSAPEPYPDEVKR